MNKCRKLNVCGMSASALDELSRVRLSSNFLLRDFLYSAWSSVSGHSNLPDDCDAVSRAGRALCERVLEPVLAKFGRFAITYGYQGPSVARLSSADRSRYSNSDGVLHQWDRVTRFGDAVYARVDILPFCVEDGQISKEDFGRWVMMNLNVDLLTEWTSSNVFCITICPAPRRVWQRWGRPSCDEPLRTVLMGAHYWQKVFPILDSCARPKFYPSFTGGSSSWPADIRGKDSQTQLNF